jgi:hypothetical protein
VKMRSEEEEEEEEHEDEEGNVERGRRRLS